MQNKILFIGEPMHRPMKISMQHFAESGSGAKEDSAANADSAANTDTTGSKDSGATKTFTQEEVNALAAKEKIQGKNAAFNLLGIDPKDTQAIAAAKAFIESQNKSKQPANADAPVDDSAKIEALRRATLAEAKVEAMVLGIKPEYVDDAITIALSKTTEENDLKTVLGEMKTKYPVWFGMTADAEDKKPEKKAGTGSSFKTADKTKTENDSIGARLAASRKVQNKPKSYWN